MRHSIFKDRVAGLIRRGAAHPEVRMRYRTLVERHPIRSLDTAITLVDRLRCAELEVRAAAIRSWGHCGRSRLTLMMLDEVRLILRMLRRHAPTRFTDLVMEIRAVDRAKRAWPSTMAGAAE
jgi:hypothetical protein